MTRSLMVEYPEGTSGADTLELHEKCAVVGAFGPDAAALAARALYVQEHRGPDSTGIGGINTAGGFEAFRAPGKARDILTEDRIAQLESLNLVVAVGHNRYATSGGSNIMQPIEGGQRNRRILYAENGTASDVRPLEDDLRERGKNPNGLNDSQMNTWAIADRLLRGASLVEAITDAYPLYVGAHSVVIVGKGPDGKPLLVAFRDACGMRPLSWGRTKNGSWVVSSETVGLDAAGASYGGEVPAGGMITINHIGMRQYQLAEPNPKFDPLEIIYFSNKDSLFKGRRIGDIRAGLGRKLAEEYSMTGRHGNVVVGVPNSAKTYAQGYAEALGIELRQDAIIKLKTDRTFMGPDRATQQALRERAYALDASLVQGMDIDVLDDSLFRNNTVPHITQQLMKAGARSVSVFIGSPPIRYPNFYGINTPTQEELVASRMSIAEIREVIGCQRLCYLSIEGMLEVFYEMTGEPGDRFDLSGFTGDYPIPIGNRNIRRPLHVGNAA